MTTREPVTVCRHNLGGRPAGRGRRSGARPSVEPPISHRRGGRRAACGRRSPGRRPALRHAAVAGRLPAAHRSGRVSGIRPSDRRGPGPAGHRGRNVRSTGRCSYNLRITRRRADSCGLHRSTSQVIRRSGSGVFFLFCRGNFAGAWVPRTVYKPSFGRRSVGGRGARAVGELVAERTRPRGRMRRARDRRVSPVPRARL